MELLEANGHSIYRTNDVDLDIKLLKFFNIFLDHIVYLQRVPSRGDEEQINTMLHKSNFIYIKEISVNSTPYKSTIQKKKKNLHE